MFKTSFNRKIWKFPFDDMSKPNKCSNIIKFDRAIRFSFFYDMNSIWNKTPGKNVRILLVNNNGTGLLRGHNLKAVSSVHNTSAEGWVRSTAFEYMSANTPEDFNKKLEYFLSEQSDKPLFFEVFCN